MQRFALLAATVFVGSVGLSSAHAQEPESFDGPQGEDDYYEPEESYDDEPIPYDESYDETAPVDDSQGEPYEEPPDGYDDTVAYDDQPAYDEGAPQEDTSVDTFYESLSPYGRWVRNASYGLVWVPNRSAVGARFVPYSTNGRWVYTNSGWMYQSNYSWGWAPFHYGRWYREPGYGWVWVPGSTWAPAWVDWRFGGDVVGWAPLPPRGRRTTWAFAYARNLNRPDIRRYVIRNPGRYYRTTQPVRHRVRSGRSYWFAGPRGAQFERVARFKARPIRIRPPRAGVVARVRFNGGRVHHERVARPRSRQITQSRRDIPARTRRPDVRRPDSRRPDPRHTRPDSRDRRPDVRDRQPTPRRDVRDRPQQGHRDAPDRRQPDRQREPDRRQPDRQRQPDRHRPEVRDRPQPSQRQPAERQRPERSQRPERGQRPDQSQRQAPERQRPEGRQPAQRQAPDRDKKESRDRPQRERPDRDRRPDRNR